MRILSALGVCDKNGIMQKVKTLSQSIKESPHSIYGAHTENMFGYVAAMLGGCEFIKKEDTEQIYAKPEITAPDYRLITNHGGLIFVEVKNCYKQKRIQFKKKYIEKLLRYPDVNRNNIKFAIYWGVIKEWTIISLDSFKFINEKYCIDIKTALIKNENSIINDVRIFGYTPLRMEISCDLVDESNSGDNFSCQFIIKEINIYTGRGQVKNHETKNLLLEMLLIGALYGFDEEEIINKTDKKLSFMYVYSPQDETHSISNPKLCGLSSLAKILSRKYALETISGDEVLRLRVELDEIERYKYFQPMSGDQKPPGTGSGYFI